MFSSVMKFKQVPMTQINRPSTNDYYINNTKFG